MIIIEKKIMIIIEKKIRPSANQSPLICLELSEKKKQLLVVTMHLILMP